MDRIIQCVPNFSEGKDITKVEAIMSVLKDWPGCNLVSYEADGDHNRTVVTLIGEPECVIDAVVAMAKATTEHIDLRKHQGNHPRMGALDVVPFIPIRGVSMNECIAFADDCARRINEATSIPVFLYAESAKHAERVALPNIRKGEFENMIFKLKDPKWAPDYGDPVPHPSAGVIAVGARNPLIAFNVDLDTTDLSIARKIAKAIRASSGGFQHIQAGPVMLEERNCTQVSMNILDYRENPLYRVIETIKMEARQYGVEVLSSEVIGLIPKEAILTSVNYYKACDKLKILKNPSLETIAHEGVHAMLFRDFDSHKIVEANLP